MVQGIRESDLLNERKLEPLRSSWKRIDASVSKFVGAYAHVEARRTSGQCDDNVMKIASIIYKSDSKNHRLRFSIPTLLGNPKGGRPMETYWEYCQ